MIYVGIDVSKLKHDCFIVDSSGEVLEDVFEFSNSREGFELFLSKLNQCSKYLTDDRIRVGLEATGHYSSCLESFIRKSGLCPVIFNPLSTNMYRKATTLRKTKTDKSDAKLIARMLLADVKDPTPVKAYHISELKSLCRHRFRLIGYQSKLKISIRRVLDMVFPELRDSVWSVHQKSCYQLLLEYPGAHSLAYAHLTRLTNLIAAGSRSKYGKTKAIELRNLARNSIGIDSTALSMELQQTICLVLSIKEQLAELNNEIKRMVKSLESPLLTIPGISFILGGIILSEINDISMFSNPAKLLAFAGLEPSMFQSGKYVADTTPMVKRGSTYLRWALLNAARLVVMRDNTFSEYYWKKRTEGKHHNVALSHTARKLVRVIFHILKTGKPFITQS